MSIVFLNISKEEFLANKKPLHKHMSLENALNVLNLRSIWFANPTIWKDPFEKQFVTAKYIKDKIEYDFPWKERVFCACFTETATSEAFWVPYSQQQIGIEFKINRKELINQLEKHSHVYDIYVGKVEYMMTKSITGSIYSIPFTKPLPTKESNLWWARLLLLKRNAYKYEDEVRIILVKKQSTVKDGIPLKFDCSPTTLIESVVLDPNIGKFTEQLLKDIFINKFAFSPITNKAGRTQNRVVKSQLYTELKERKIKL